jgi:hypothetical protein
MTIRLWLRLAELLIILTLSAIVFDAWRTDRRDRAQLAADLAAGRQALAQADARQHDRDAQLLQSLATVAAGKRTVTAPAQIVRDLPNQVLLPVPITLQSLPCESALVAGDELARQTSASGTSKRPTPTLPAPPCSSGAPFAPEGLDSTGSTSSKQREMSAQPSAVIPTADLKPLYDFTLDCKACQAKLDAAQADLTDEQSKTAVLTRERNEAVRAAKGGSLLRRIARNAKWLAIGIAAGAIAAKAHP